MTRDQTVLVETNDQTMVAMVAAMLKMRYGDQMPRIVQTYPIELNVGAHCSLLPSDQDSTRR